MDCKLHTNKIQNIKLNPFHLYTTPRQLRSPISTVSCRGGVELGGFFRVMPGRSHYG